MRYYQVMIPLINYLLLINQINWEKLFIIRGLVEKSFGVYSITIQKMASIKQWVKRSGQNNRMKYNC